MLRKPTHSSALNLVCFASIGMLFSSIGNAEDWTQFRGPSGTAVVASDKAFPSVLSESNRTWSTEIPGQGWSSPVYAGKHIWLTTAETTKATESQIAQKTKDVQFAQIKTVAGSIRLRAICVDAESGKILHNKLLASVNDPDLVNPLNSYASPTPAIANGRVVCHFGSYGTWCLDVATGETIWENKLVIDHSVGPGSSPVISGNIVVIPCDGIDQQFVAGLDLQTGKTAWQTKRPPMGSSNGEYQKAYSTPLLIKLGGQTQAVIPGAQWVCAYEPATGKEIWRADYQSGFSTTPMPVYESGLLVCSTGYMAGKLFAIDPKGAGDISSQITWQSTNGGNTMPTSVARNGLIYSVGERGILSVHKASDGSLVSRARLGGKYASSPLLVGDMLYVGSQAGELSVFQIDGATGKPTLLQKNQLDGAIMASPIVIDNDLLVRTSKSLVRYASK